MIDGTHDPQASSWVTSANGHPDFPIQNLPLGVLSFGTGAPRVVVAIGDMALDVGRLLNGGFFKGEAALAAQMAAGQWLNPLFAMGAAPRRALRARLFELLSSTSAERAPEDAFLPIADGIVHLPAFIGDYTDFYAGIHHAVNVGKLFRPDNPLLPNYKHVPIGYHGRSSSVRPSGAPVVRPTGQRKSPDGDVPVFGPSQRLDYELELGVWIGPGNQLGSRIPIASASAHIVGLSLLNDWSARDLQAWEYQPLGPFLAKSFITSVSPWVVTSEALAPYRVPQPPRPDGDPAPLPYLTGGEAYSIELEVLIETPAMRDNKLSPHRLSITEATNLYWTVEQLIAHHTVNGCNLQAGDLLGTGTISASRPDGYGSLLELTGGGKSPITLASGETRTFLQDGDTVIMRGHAHAPGRVSIGFGECRGTVAPSPPVS
jgi:fumarylacetoacetase